MHNVERNIRYLASMTGGGGFHFLAMYGIAYTAKTEACFPIEHRGRRHFCFQNATNLAMSTDHTYCEGVVGVQGIPIEHAWCIDKAGTVIDPTLEWRGAEEEYFGIPFRTDYLCQCLAINTHYGLLGWMSKSSRALIAGEVPPKDFLAGMT